MARAWYTPRMDITMISMAGLRDPGQQGAFDASGRLQLLPAAWWRQFSQEEIAVFCHRHAIYCVPTTELVAWLRERLAGRRAIEIGAGTGVLADALGIPATDNRMQEWPEVAAHYQRTRQPVIEYGANVEKLDAEVALARYRPEVVLAAWVTHKYKPSEHWREGNMHGVEEQKILRQAEYIFVGHAHVHRHKPLLAHAHETFEPHWLVSRATSQGKNQIRVWARRAPLAA